MSSSARYCITCDDESSLVLSNKREEKLWQDFESLVEILAKDAEDLPSIAVLMEWKNKSKRKAVAKDPYSWRAVIDALKNSDLKAKCKGKSAEELTILTDKPLMLKIAGEVTSALMHSYNLGHRISFSKTQNDSKEPS